MEKDTEKGNILTGKFISNPEKKSGEEKFVPKNQTNPIYKQLVSLIHSKIDKKSNYRSFSDFKPKDLR
ncbi:MAG: hypothetical protein PHC34_09710 [Candidatus Gastranaerophilales bacterium]|nr:hypothetical protein [Candidatus Gastranaerophilales bacterium]